MAIPWLIGGAVVAAAAVITAAVSDDDGPSRSSSTDTRDEERRLELERRLERERKHKKTLARKAELQAYADQVTENLAKKYGGSDPESLRKKLQSVLSVSAASREVTVKRDSTLLQLTESFPQQQQAITSLQNELNRLDFAMLVLEELSDEFK